MAWTVAFDDTFGRASTAAGAAGSTTGAGNGWTDVQGGIWSLAGGKLVGTTSDIGGYTRASLVRPQAEAAAAQRVVATLPGAPTAETAILLRSQPAAATYYLMVLEAPTNDLHLYAVSGGGVTSLGSVAVSPALVAGHTYTLDASATGASPTALSMTVTDATAGAVVATLAASDGTAALQGAGVPGLLVWAPGGGSGSATFSEVTTYTQAAAAPGSITVSPTSLTAETGGQAVAVTGSGASLLGATFTVSGGLGAALLAQSVQGATAASLSISPGLPGYGPLAVTSSAGGSASLAVAAPDLGPLAIGFVGDSITAGTNGNPVAAMAAWLGAQGYAVTAVNRGVSGTSTADWLPGGSYLPAAVSAFGAAGVTVVQVMLGTNDWRTPNSFSPAQHGTNMRAIVLALRAAGFLVVLCKSPWAKPNEDAGGGSVWPPDVNDRIRDGWRLDAALCDGAGVFAGDTGFHQYTALNNLAVLDGYGIHPKDAATNTLLGQYWAVAFLHRFGAAGGVVNRWAR